MRSQTPPSPAARHSARAASGEDAVEDAPPQAERASEKARDEAARRLGMGREIPLAGGQGKGLGPLDDSKGHQENAT